MIHLRTLEGYSRTIVEVLSFLLYAILSCPSFLMLSSSYHNVTTFLTSTVFWQHHISYCSVENVDSEASFPDNLVNPSNKSALR